MRLLRALLYAFVVVVLAGGWAFLYWQSGAEDLAAIDGTRSALNELRAIDSRWNDQLIAARGGAKFDPARHGRAYAELELRALRTPYPGLGLALVGVKHAFDDKAGALRRISQGEPLFEQAWLTPTGPRLDALSRLLDRAFGEQLTWVDLYRAWLLYYSAFLLTVAGYAFYRASGSAAR